jgi:hypothetical protein
LYEQLLRYHNENDSSDEDTGHDRLRHNRKIAPSPPVEEIDDKKPAAIPKPKSNRNRSPQTLTPNRPVPHEPTPRSFHQEALQESRRREEATQTTDLYTSGTTIRPGVVAINEPAIHPNSVMYHAAYGGRAISSYLKTEVEPIDAKVDVIQLAISLESTSSSLRRGRSKSPTFGLLYGRGRSNSPTNTMKARSRSPKYDPLGAKSAHTPRSKIRSPMMYSLSVSTHSPKGGKRAPLAGSSHNSGFYDVPSIGNFDTKERKKFTSRATSDNQKSSTPPITHSPALGRPTKIVARTRTYPESFEGNYKRDPAPSTNNEEDLDPELKLAMELSTADLMKTSSPQKVPTPDSRTNHGASEKSESAYSMCQDEAFSYSKQDNDISSSFAKAAMSKDDSLADVLLALKLSAEEGTAGNGNSQTRNHLSSDQKRQSTSLRELLELESAGSKKDIAGDDSVVTKDSSVIDLVAAGISANEGDKEKQLRILEEIQEAEEKRLFELALKASQGTATNDDDELRMALEASRHAIQPAIRNTVNSAKKRPNDFLKCQKRAMEEFSKRKSLTLEDKKSPPRPPPLDHDRSRGLLLQRGTAETNLAINSGEAQIITCRGCKVRLQAPKTYSLVFCPKCQTISPT